MTWLLEVLIYAVARPALQLVLGLFGYDLDWERTDGRKDKGWRLVAAALLCCVLSALVLIGLVWLLVIVAAWI